MGEYRWDELITYSPFALVAGKSAEWLWPSGFPLRHLLNPESWKHRKSEPKSSVSWYWGDHVKWKKRITQLQALLGVFRPRWNRLSRLWASLGHSGSGRGPNRSSKAKYRPQSQAPSLSHIFVPNPGLLGWVSVFQSSWKGGSWLVRWWQFPEIEIGHKPEGCRMSGNILKSSRRQRGHGPEVRGDPSPYPMVMMYVLSQVLDCQRCSRGLSGEYVIFLGTLCRLVVPRRVRIYWYPHILRGIGLMYER